MYNNVVAQELATLPAAICGVSLKKGGTGRRGGENRKGRKLKPYIPILEITHPLQWIFFGFAIATVRYSGGN